MRHYAYQLVSKYTKKTDNIVKYIGREILKYRLDTTRYSGKQRFSSKNS